MIERNVKVTVAFGKGDFEVPRVRNKPPYRSSSIMDDLFPAGVVVLFVSPWCLESAPVASCGAYRVSDYQALR